MGEDVELERSQLEKARIIAKMDIERVMKFLPNDEHIHH
jgi:hypothetical protein